MSEAEIPVLKLNEDATHDYTLIEGVQSVWVTVDNISVYIVRTDEGVVVDLYPAGHEMNDSIASTWALFADAEVDEGEENV